MTATSIEARTSIGHDEQLAAEREGIPIHVQDFATNRQPRSMSRALIEIETDSQQVTVGNTVLHGPVTARVEVYSDSLDGLARQCRTPEQQRAWDAAVEICRGAIKEWEREQADVMPKRRRGETAEEHKGRCEEWTHKRCNLSPSVYLAHFGFRKGIGPLARVEIIAPDGKRCTALEWAEMTTEQRAPFLRDAPSTPEVAQLQSHDRMSEAMERALARGIEAAMTSIAKHQKAGSK